MMTPNCSGDDSFENNDDIGQAQAISLNANYANLNVNLSDPDWFMIDLSIGNSYFIDMDKESYSPNITLLDNSGRVVGWGSEIIQFHRCIQINVEFSGTYYIAILGDLNGLQTDYSLMVSEFSGYDETWDFVGDKYENNNNFQDAFPIISNTNYTDGVVSSFDIDWFKINLTEGYAYHFDLDKESYNPEFILFDSEGTEIAFSSEIIPYHRNIQINICKNDTYYIKLLGEPDNGINLTYYRFYVYEENEGFNMTYEFGPDRYEYNDDMANAYPLMVNTNYTGIYMQDNEIDWYKINLTEGYGYHIDMVKNGPGAYFFLYDSKGTEIASSSEIIPYHRNIQINICKNDTYYLQFIGEMDENETAFLEICVYEDTNFNITYNFSPDRYEYNDDMANAYPLMVNTNYTGIYMQDNEIDWYKINLTEGYGYHIDMVKNGPGAYFFLYDSKGTEIASSSEIIPYHRNIQINICKNDTYYLQFIGEMDANEIAVLEICVYEEYGHNSTYTYQNCGDNTDTDGITSDTSSTTNSSTSDTTNEDTPSFTFDIPGFSPPALITVSVFAFVLIGKKRKKKMK